MKSVEVRDIKRAYKIFLIMMLVAVSTFIIAMIFSPSDEIVKSITDKIPSDSVRKQGLNRVWMYVINNAFQVPFQMFLLALLPIPLIHLLNIISTSVITGIIFGFAVNVVTDQGWILVLASLPHTMFEILAFSFVSSGLFPLNKSIVRKVTNLFRQEKKENLSIGTACFNLIIIYIFIALPLFVIAAFLETYLTDFIMYIF